MIVITTGSREIIIETRITILNSDSAGFELY
jgi:hypothetical protein